MLGLYKYQEKVIKFLLEKYRAGVFLEMGLGKTRIVLHYINILLKIGDLKKALIIAPASVVKHVWDAENKKWGYNLDIVKVVGTSDKRLKLLAEKHDIYIISSDNIAWLKDVKKLKFDMIVVDEASQFKNTNTRRFRGLRKLVKSVKRLVLLTGTPITHDVYNLWGLMYLIDAGERLFKSKMKFKETWFTNWKYIWKVKPGATDEILDRIKDVVITMQTKDYIELPDLIEVVLRVDINCKYYKELEEQFIIQLQNDYVEASCKLTELIKLQQVANGIVYLSNKDGYKVLHLHKLNMLKSLIDASDDNMIVMVHRKSDESFILDNIKESESLNVDRWNDRKIKVMVMNPLSGGYGLNLQEGGSIIVWFGLTYNFEVFAQSIARLHRNGQKKIVRNYILLASNTVDEAVYNSLLKKKQT